MNDSLIARRDDGSFRDPSGYVFRAGGRTFRTVNQCAFDDYRFVRDSGLLKKLADARWLVDCEEVDRSVLGGAADADCRVVLEHPTLPFVSYPYEWSFPALKAAALFHLDLQLKALESGVALSDASAYNVQFVGAQPKFIDILSFRPYREGEFWLAHRQFCEQFLNPLLLRSYLGVAHNAWYRGSLEGITTAELNRLLPWWRKCLSWNAFSQVYLQAAMQSSAIARPKADLQSVKARKLPRSSFVGLLTQLRNWIAGLVPADTGLTVWGNYASDNTYSSAEASVKRKFVSEFVARTQPRLVWDLGCNTGDYSAAALAAGARSVIGFDFDQRALEVAFSRAQAEKLDFLPLFLDAANPSPGQGWDERERKGMQVRASADAIVALAFEHHLAIGRNVPLPQVVAWLCSLAPRGVIEFVRKDDPTVQQMLSLRQDIFQDYTEEAFTAALRREARIVKSEAVTSAGRRLFWFERR